MKAWYFSDCQIPMSVFIMNKAIAHLYQTRCACLTCTRLFFWYGKGQATFIVIGLFMIVWLFILYQYKCFIFPVCPSFTLCNSNHNKNIAQSICHFMAGNLLWCSMFSNKQKKFLSLPLAKIWFLSLQYNLAL